MIMLQEILKQFISSAEEFSILPFGNGLIHSTHQVVKDGKPEYILQQINQGVFKKPVAIAENLQKLAEYLTYKHSNVILPLPLNTSSGESYAMHDGIFYRLTPFVPGSHSLDACETADQAYEAAFQFGRFTASFEGMDVTGLQPTIPSFHDLSFRWEQFTDALENGIASRKSMASKEIQAVLNHYPIVEKYRGITLDSAFRQRVTHHDTKINNVLFDLRQKGICVIDLDTVMPGFFISDLGDMCRTYLSPGSEEDTDLEKVFVRKDFMKAILDGYLECMADQLTSEEKNLIPYAGEFMIYMQAIRFLADFLVGDKYYGIRYELNNYDRARNQLHLLRNYQLL